MPETLPAEYIAARAKYNRLKRDAEGALNEALNTAHQTFHDATTDVEAKYSKAIEPHVKERDAAVKPAEADRDKAIKDAQAKFADAILKARMESDIDRLTPATAASQNGAE